MSDLKTAVEALADKIDDIAYDYMSTHEQNAFMRRIRELLEAELAALRAHPNGVALSVDEMVEALVGYEEIMWLNRSGVAHKIHAAQIAKAGEVGK